MYDVSKIVSALKGKRADHRVFRLAENLCMNLILSLRDYFLIRKEGKVQSPLSGHSRFCHDAIMYDYLNLCRGHPSLLKP